MQYSAIRSAIAGKGEPTHAVWIGLNDRIAEAGTNSSKYVWSDNSSSWAATPWAAGQPAVDTAAAFYPQPIPMDEDSSGNMKAYVSLVMQGPKSNPTTPFYLSAPTAPYHVSPGASFQSSAGMSERVLLKKAMWDCFGFSEPTRNRPPTNKGGSSYNCWGNTTALHSGDVVSINWPAVSKVTHCGHPSGKCSAQNYPPEYPAAYVRAATFSQSPPCPVIRLYTRARSGSASRGRRRLLV